MLDINKNSKQLIKSESLRH